MKKIHLIMPMGGAGSRFSKQGFSKPKPLLEIFDKPFFYWSTRSIEKYVELESLTFVVLKDHVEKFQIDLEIKKYFKDAKIIVLDHILNGAVLTCLEGIKNIKDDFPIVFNDCDHIFYSSVFNKYCNEFNFETIDGALLTFESNDPKFSFLELNSEGNVTRTVEKQAISNKAICGAYYFKNAETFINNANEYLNNCNYNEYFVSGVYNIMAKHNKIIKHFDVDSHLAFGTPEEYSEALNHESDFKELL
ncbi:MAG: glycosyltransferase family 2 protein [Bacilli bacterium]|nr:glycosyltransferase family 2 protein [Bacilli bacterium]